MEAAKEKQRRLAALSKVPEINKVSTRPISSPSPDTTPVANAPTPWWAENSGQLSHTPHGVSGNILELVVQGEERTMESEQNANAAELRQNSRDTNLSEEDTEALVARDTFEGMLETLSRAKDSIARATRHALDCAKFGITDQVMWQFSLIAKYVILFACSS